MCSRPKATIEIEHPFKQALSTISLSAEKRTIIEERYINLLYESHMRCNRITTLYNTNRVIVTIGSIIVPALMSIELTNSGTIGINSLHWITWIISLMVTISNGIMTLFKFDKKYYILHTSYEQLKTEGWQYLALTGQYKHSETTHENEFTLFCRTIEKIRMRQMDEEYVKIQEMNGKSNSGQSGILGNTFDIQKTPSNEDFIIQVTKIVKEQMGGKKDNAILDKSDTPQNENNA